MKLEETGVEHSFQHASEIGLNRGPCGMAAEVLQQVLAQVDEKAGAAVSPVYSQEQLLPWRFGCALQLHKCRIGWVPEIHLGRTTQCCGFGRKPDVELVENSGPRRVGKRAIRGEHVVGTSCREDGAPI